MGRAPAVLLVAMVAGCRAAAPPAVECPAAPAPVGGEPAGTAAAAAAVESLEQVGLVSDELQGRIAGYLAVRRADVADLSADGKRLVVLTRLGEAAQVHEVSGPLADRRQLTFETEPVRGARLLPGGALLYWVDRGGDENYQIYRLDPGARPVRLTDGKSRNQDLVVNHDGSRIAWSSNARNGVDFDLWTADPLRPDSARLAAQGAGWWAAVDLSRDGRRALVIETLSITEARLFLVDLESGSAELVAEQAAFRTARFAPDGGRAFVTSDRDGEFVVLHEVELATRSFRPLSRDLPWNVEELALSPAGDRLAFTINQGGRSALHLRDLRRGTTSPVRGAPAGVLRHLRFDRAGKRLAMTVDAGDRVGDAWVLDVASGRAAAWTASETGGVDPRRFVAPELVEYTTFDGARIPAWLYRPKRTGKLPVVVELHGGPESQARPIFSPLHQFLAAELGVAVLLPNVRGSDGYGKSYLALDDGMKRGDAVKDVGALLDWIAGNPNLDEGRVAVMGGSYGGFLVLAALVEYGERLRAGIDRVGISSFVTFLENTSAYRRDRRRVEYGDERVPEMRAFLEKVSPLNRAREIRSPLFVVQGGNDPRVPASEAEQIVRAVRAAGRAAWYLAFDDEGHGVHKHSNRSRYESLAAAFLIEHLGLTL
jgi:dipeptidyl aminopeptidase/acylaminoacyl peptidase